MKIFIILLFTTFFSCFASEESYMSGSFSVGNPSHLNNELNLAIADSISSESTRSPAADIKSRDYDAYDVGTFSPYQNKLYKTH